MEPAKGVSLVVLMAVAWDEWTDDNLVDLKDDLSAVCWVEWSVSWKVECLVVG
jgi:GH25 family lysozyme M1 (1,4-beta-N-acetylmuramidase)